MQENPYTSPQEPIGAQHVGGKWTLPIAILLGFLVMIPWPLAAIGLCHSLELFDRTSEAMFLFGGVTMILLIPLALLGPEEIVFIVLIAVVWLGVVVLPPTFFLRKRGHRKSKTVGLLAFQASFSLAQAGMGLLMMVGKTI